MKNSIQMIDRPPRIQPELPFNKFEIPSPPENPEDAISKLIQLALPMTMIVGYVFVTMFGGRGGGSGALILIPMALSVLASTGFSIYSFIREKNQRLERERQFHEQIVELNKDMHGYHDLQRRFYRYNYPDTPSTIRVITDAKHDLEKPERTLRSNARIWERRVSDDDFGSVRLGMGTLPSTVVYEVRSGGNFSSPLAREAMKLDADSRYVSDIPIIITLRHKSEDESDGKEKTTPITPTTHALGIAGARDAVYESIRSILAHYVVFHSPSDTRLYVLASKYNEWDWVETLPHCQPGEYEQLCFVSEIKEVADDADEEGDELDQYMEGIRKILSQRKMRMEDNEENSNNSGRGNPGLPFMLLVVDLLDMYEKAGERLRNIESDAALSILIEEGPQLGAAVIFLVPERSKVPGGCKSVIEIERTTPATNSKQAQHQQLFFRYAEQGVNTFRYIGAADNIVNRDESRKLAEELSTLNLRQSAGANLADAVAFFDLMGYSSLDELKVDALKNWQRSIQPKYANWLRAKVGRMSGNKARTLVFSAKKDGVHGMVAGSTGSGKSELLISLIAVMAVTYDPSVVNFVLVDYKGGGAFKEFERLPHCVDIITNLAGDGVTRMFTAIKSEMQRRQVLNNETDTKNIVEYRKKNFHTTHYPYPYLFIIIDEFAEMIADRAEYRGELESITRIGRSLGVSLILAAQRPSGITDQMRSNIKFRISLRVETQGESREMLRRSDAAFLPTGIPGRGYLQVGNEEIELIQVAYTGDPYVDPNSVSQEKVIWPDRRRAEGVDPGIDTQDQSPPELYKVIVTTLDTLSRDNNIPIQRAPWPNFLPRELALTQHLISEDPNVNAVTFEEYLLGIDDIMVGLPREHDLTLNPALNKWINGSSGWVEDLNWREYAMRPVVGLIDNPYAAKQIPLTVDFPRGHAVVFGGSGWGKTTFLRSMLMSLAATHSPNQMHMYILDLGGRNFSVLDKLPHSGAVIIPDGEGYEERVEQLLREINDIVDARKLLLNDAGIADIYQYNAVNPKNTQPAILVAIDNFAEFTETFGEGPDSNVESVLDKLISIARQAKPYAIHFIITIGSMAELSNQIFSLFTERYTLKLSDNTEYRAIVGGRVDDINDIPGRGYTKVGPQPLSFQVAVSAGISSDGSLDSTIEMKEIDQLAQFMSDYARTSGKHYAKPRRVDAMPKAILFKSMLPEMYATMLQREIRFEPDLRPQLNALMSEAWEDSIKPENADWLKVTVGVMSGNRPRTLQLEAKKDGVHGMIAGGTGAGKSELLMTLIIGLAVRYDPSILNFILVDYKGGGAFDPFKDMPHTVDLVTNLNKSRVRRMFTAINAEMGRRQALNARTGTKDIVEYRAKGFHLDPQWGPFPHLFIIIDEYAEMISDTPEFRDELESITRVGRSIGVNLLLASQRPMGVTDQMRANIKYRICLRVEDIETSREMLRRSDAAFLPSGMPGRGYLQVGNENLDLIQVSYTGESYDYAVAADGTKAKFYELIVSMAQELLNPRPRPQTPWPAPLPDAITFEQLLNPRYVDKTYLPLMTLGRSQRVSLNAFVGDWFENKGQWFGIDWNHVAMRAIVGVLDDPGNARQMPLILDFNKGHAVVFGASGWGKTTMIRSMVLSLAATHSPNEFNAHVLDLGGRNLEVLRSIPHVGTVILPDEQGYEERIQQLWRELNNVVDERKKLFSDAGVSTLAEYNSQNAAKPKPAILVAIDNFGEYIETFGDDKDSNNLLEVFVALARQGKAYGLHILITASRLNILSSKLYSLFTERLTFRISDAGDYSAIVGARLLEVEEIPGRGAAKVGRDALSYHIALPPGTIGKADILGADGQPQVTEKLQIRGEAGQIRVIGKHMNAHIANNPGKYQPPLGIAALPKSSSYRQVLQEMHNIGRGDRPFVEELKEATAKTWEYNGGTGKQAGWLAACLGIVSGNRPRTLQLEAKRDGVHGMVAGGTGAGKSELLMTLIVGLALNYSPSILNFVLVDFKGGGAFKPFENMPHCVDIVTNLNKSAVDRMFTSIDAEIRRRQALNAMTGTKDIVEYRERGFHLKPEFGAYPHLFIIIDEYAEMFDSNPEYLPSLESITRVGRAQGVNLLLASQQPKGVTDQMRANIKLRLCLRVEQPDTSRELLRKPDAAFLPNGMPGRGYLQIGNENLELIQVSYTGESQVDDREVGVLWPEREPEPVSTSEDTPKLFDTVVQISRELVNYQPTPKPWPNFLPERVTLQSPIVNAKDNTIIVFQPAVTDWINGDTERLWPGVNWETEAMRTTALLVDDPNEATQMPFVFDFSTNHLAIYGDSGWGKTSLLRSIITGLAATHSPDELHAYVVDLGGRNFRSLRNLPHIGALIYADDETFEEQMLRLFSKMERLTRERQQIFSDAGVNTIYEYNQQFPDQALPAIVVAIDNIAIIHENYDAVEESVLIPLVRRSLSVGIAFIVTANFPNNMSNRFGSLFGERITFKQGQQDRYMDIVGRGAIEFGDIPGRGYIRVGKRPLLFQSTLPVGLVGPDGRDHRNEAEELDLMGMMMQAKVQQLGGMKTTPDPIQILPQIVPLREMLDTANEVAEGKVIWSVVGQSNNLMPAMYDLKKIGPHAAIAGPPISGKTTLLYNWVLSLADRYTPDQVAMVLIDTRGRFFKYGGKRTFADLPHVLQTVSEIDQMSSLLENLQIECQAFAQQAITRPVYIFIDNFEDFSDEAESKRSVMTDIAVLTRRYGGEGVFVVIAGTLDSSANDLRRRVMSANFGIGLRTAQAVESLRVMRTPSEVRGKELPMGRGFMVKAGQTTLIQVASPYTNGSQVVVEDASDEAERVINALDGWVETIAERYPERAAWSTGAITIGDKPTSVEQDPKVARLAALIRQGVQRLMPRIKESNGEGSIAESIMQNYISMDFVSWNSSERLRSMLHQMLIDQHMHDGLDLDTATMMADMTNSDDESLMLAFESTLVES